MIIAFNCILVAIALLIAYWWANQGLFSSILHFVCVVVAGALALAVWEPLAVFMLERGFMENYAWGISLLLPFAVFLLVARIASDKLVPDNLNFPAWANFTFGGVFGVASGVLTIGMCLIGGGFVQSTKDFMSFEGTIRSMATRGQPDFANQQLWVPMHHLTEDFFAFLSVGALAPERGASLRTAYPKLADTAMSLHRDSFAGGKARTSTPPGAVTLGRLFYSPDFDNGQGDAPGAFVLEIEVGAAATDSGGVLSIGASQIRLVENVGNESREPNVAYPHSWSQPLDSGGREVYLFDDISNYATNVPGQQSTKLFFAFPANGLGDQTRAPSYMQLKGLRFRLPQPEAPVDGRAMTMIMRGIDASAGNQTPLFDPKAKTIAKRDIELNFTIAPAVANINELTNMEQVDQYLTAGGQEFARGGKSPSKTNRVLGIYAADGTSVVRLNLTRRFSSIDVWNELKDYRKQAGEDATLVLVDSNGNTYAPIGFVWVKPEGVEVRLDPKRGIPTIKDFPFQPSSGSNELYAIFAPTEGIKIVSIRLGNVVLANADFVIEPQKR